MTQRIFIWNPAPRRSDAGTVWVNVLFEISIGAAEKEVATAVFEHPKRYDRQTPAYQAARRRRRMPEHYEAIGRLRMHPPTPMQVRSKTRPRIGKATLAATITQVLFERIERERGPGESRSATVERLLWLALEK